MGPFPDALHGGEGLQQPGAIFDRRLHRRQDGGRGCRALCRRFVCSRFDFADWGSYGAPGQADAAFRAYFGLEPPAQLQDLAALTPGDFAVVRRKAEILDVLDEPEELARMLREECEAKPGHPQVVGFRA